MNASELTKIFVYGTLKPGESNYGSYCAPFVVSVTAAIAHGQLYALPYGYPAMTVGKGYVHGFLLAFNDRQILSSLDQLEDYEPSRAAVENEYQRCQIKVYNQQYKFLSFAWAYLMTPERVSSYGGVPLPSGIWTPHQPLP